MQCTNPPVAEPGTGFDRSASEPKIGMASPIRYGAMTNHPVAEPGTGFDRSASEPKIGMTSPIRYDAMH